MQLRVGYELVYEVAQPTQMILGLSIHYSRASDLVVPDHLRTDPAVPVHGYRDGFGNWCHRIVAPRGVVRLTADAVIAGDAAPDPVVADAWEHPVEQLPEEALVFLLGSRYCETDRLTETAWDTFSAGPRGLGARPEHL